MSCVLKSWVSINSNNYETSAYGLLLIYFTRRIFHYSSSYTYVTNYLNLFFPTKTIKPFSLTFID